MKKKLFFQYSLFFQVIYQQAEQTVIIVKSTFALKLTATHEFIFYLFFKKKSIHKQRRL